MAIIKKTVKSIIGKFSKKEEVPTRFDEVMGMDRFIINLNHDDLEDHLYTDTLLVSCVDFRLRGEIAKIMSDILHLIGDYDEISLPGASLALVQDKYPDWNRTMSEVIGLLKKVHHIKRVVFLDHRDCTAYRVLKGDDAVDTRSSETKTHKAVFKEVREFMKINFPELEVYTLLIGLDGMVENFRE